MSKTPSNSEIADLLERIADLLETQDENPFRVRAYREGAESIRDSDKPAAQLIKQDKTDALTELPHIGEGLAAVIGEYVTEGRSILLDDLEKKVSPADVFKRVPGLGAELAKRIQDKLDIQSLEDLEVAAHDGSLAEVEGFGPRRIEAIQKSLAGMLSQSARRSQRERQPDAPKDRPPVALLFEMDAMYRERAKAGKLPTVAPKRFNPDHKAWLSILNTEKDGWKFTLLFSNTAQAHELGKTDDWVVIYYERDGKERQNTVVTETKGELEGKRVVRGRDRETREYYKKEKKK